MTVAEKLYDKVFDQIFNRLVRESGADTNETRAGCWDETEREINAMTNVELLRAISDAL